MYKTLESPFGAHMRALRTISASFVILCPGPPFMCVGNSIVYSLLHGLPVSIPNIYVRDILHKVQKMYSDVKKPLTLVCTGCTLISASH